MIHRAFVAGVWVPVLLALGNSPANAERVDFAEGARTILFGDRADRFGYDLATGDIDGDGYIDILTTAVHADGPNNERFGGGEVYIWFGRPQADIDSLYDITTDADVTFFGAWPPSIGRLVACGDIDGDGRDDVLFGAELGVDQVYVFFGRSRDQFQSVYDLRFATADVTIANVRGRTVEDWSGSRETDALGFSLLASDINGDRRADIIVSNNLVHAPFDDRGVSGALYVIFGRDRSAWPSTIDADYGTTAPHPDIVFYGAHSSDRLAFSVATGDLDGDGMTDLIFSSARSYGEDHLDPLVGEVYVFWGRRNWEPVYDLVLESYDFALQGPDHNRFGYRLATGDIDGDGHDDLIVGSRFNHLLDYLPGGRRNVAEYRVFFGRHRSMWRKRNDAVALTDVLILGADTGEVLTDGVPDNCCITSMWVSTGDHNADGKDELLIGAGGSDAFMEPSEPAREDAGQCYLLYGRERAEWTPFFDLREDYDVVFLGATGAPFGTGTGFDALGWKTALADLDGSGTDDLLMVAPWGDAPLDSVPDAGELYVIFGVDSFVTAVPATATRADAVALPPNYPNPFNPATTIRFLAPRGSKVSLIVYNARGQRVAHLLPATVATGEVTEVRWEGLTDDGRALPSGVYFIRLAAGGAATSRKITLVR